MNYRSKILLLLVFSLQSLVAQETFKTMFYNVLNYPDQAPASRINDLAVILDDYQPDLFMICELNNETGANTILTTLQTLNSDFERASFQLNTSDDTIGDQNDLQNMIYYDSSKFVLEDFNTASGTLDQFIVSTLFRDFNHYKLKLNTTNQTTNPLVLNVIVAHLKASSGSQNEQSRLAMVEDLGDYLDTLPSDEFVMLAGDLNLYSSSEPAFIDLLETTNNITFIDPANRIGSWHNNTDFIDVMTQSTRRTGSGLGGSEGGFDDRFDFILTSENMQTSSELSFVDGSYKVWGNNALSSCYNQSINSTNCGDATSEFSQNIRNALYNFSDHLPVTLMLQTSETLSIPDINVLSGLQIIGTNLIRSTIQLKIPNNQIRTNQLKIYNALGQLIETIAINNSEYITQDVSYLSNGLYYITSSNAKVAPLKFIKVD